MSVEKCNAELFERLRNAEDHDYLYALFVELYQSSKAMRKLMFDGDVDFGDCQITDRWHHAMDIGQEDE